MNKFRISPDFDPQAFLDKYWQQEPVLLAGLLTDFVDPLTPEELAGMACEEVVESRLFTLDSDKKLQLEHGPIPEQRFTSLPEENYTLLVQAADQWDSDVAALKSCFEFIPSWRIDDVMISYATPGGGVGPHFDFYDVFLIQGTGQRRWRVGPRYPSAAAGIDQTGLAILESFQTEQEYVLNPGDVLYVPPQFGHWGTAVESGLCYSIGFRAPSQAEMLEGFSDELMSGSDPADRFTDPQPKTPARSGEIEAETVATSFQALSKLLNDPAKFHSWFGSHVTRLKYPDMVTPKEPPLDIANLRGHLRAGGRIASHPASRFAFSEDAESGQLQLFVDGEVFLLSSEFLNVVSEICKLSNYNNKLKLGPELSPEEQELLLKLLNQGSLLFL